jgi:hypothetical protein
MSVTVTAERTDALPPEAPVGFSGEVWAVTVACPHDRITVRVLVEPSDRPSRASAEPAAEVMEMAKRRIRASFLKLVECPCAEREQIRRGARLVTLAGRFSTN